MSYLKAKMHQIRWGAYSLQAGFKGATSKGKKGMGRKGPKGRGRKWGKGRGSGEQGNYSGEVVWQTDGQTDRQRAVVPRSVRWGMLRWLEQRGCVASSQWTHHCERLMWSYPAWTHQLLQPARCGHAAQRSCGRRHSWMDADVKPWTHSRHVPPTWSVNTHNHSLTHSSAHITHTHRVRVRGKLKVQIQAHFKDFQAPKLHFSSTKIIDKKPYPRRGHSKFRLQSDIEASKVKSNSVSKYWWHAYMCLLQNCQQMQNFKICKIEIQGLFKDFQVLSSTLSVFKHFQEPWSFYSKFKHFEGFLKHAMNPAE